MKTFFSWISSLLHKKDDQTSVTPTAETPKLPPAPAEKSVQEKKKSRPRKRKPPWTADLFPVDPEEGKTRFHDLGLPDRLMHAICDLKFSYCTQIQAELLPHTLKGTDATGRAQTGTGKTAAFIITLLKRFSDKPFTPKIGCPRALILAPTRELVHQIEKDFIGLAKYTPMTIAPIFGGTNYQQQQNRLTKRPADVIVATPGRLLDFMQKKLINLSRVEAVVLDEADRMLDMGFIPDVRRIVYQTPPKDKRQTLFFSATFTDEVMRLAQSWTKKDRVRIEVDPDQAEADSIRQVVYLSTEEDKFRHMYNVIVGENLSRVIVFVNMKVTANFLGKKLTSYGIQNRILSGDVSQDKRFKVLEAFTDGRLRVLVATDVAARGLHIKNISHVINYDLPTEPEHYIHRIGRTGRAGATGTAISFADEMSSFSIPKIEEVLGHKILCEYPSDEVDKELPKPKPIPKNTKRTKNTKNKSSYRKKSSGPPRKKGKPGSSGKKHHLSRPPKKQ